MKELADNANTAATLSRRKLLLDFSGFVAVNALPTMQANSQDSSPGTAGAPSAIMERLSTYMGNAAQRELPADVLEKAKQHILDTLAAMISGAALPPGRIALQFARLYSGGHTATIVGSRLLFGPIEAALANGMLAHADETDDSHAPSHSHPGCAVIAAALVAGEQFRISGVHLLRAVTLGYDIGTRVVMTLGGLDFQVATHHDAHSVANTFGASAAAACAASLDAKQMRWVLDYAAQQASGIAAWQRDTQHIEKAFVFGGAPTRNGVTAALLIQAGATGVTDVFSGADNFLMAFAPKANPAGLVDQLGERYEVTRTNIKKWSVGSPIQAALDALALIMAKHPVRASDVQAVTVRLATSEAKTVNDRLMPEISLQQMVAIMLVDHTVTFAAAHDVSRTHDPAIAEARAKVRLVPDETLEKLYPQLVAVVEVTGYDGETRRERVDKVRGTVDNPMSREEVVAKARDLMRPSFGAERTTRLIDAVFSLESLSNVADLLQLLRH